MNSFYKVVLAFSLTISLQTFSMLRLAKPGAQTALILRKNLMRKMFVKRFISTQEVEKLKKIMDKIQTPENYEEVQLLRKALESQTKIETKGDFPIVVPIAALFLGVPMFIFATDAWVQFLVGIFYGR